MVTSGKEWRKVREEGVEFTLPSGNKAALRPVGTDLLIRLGRVPEVFVAALFDDDKDSFDKATEAHPAKFVEFMDVFCEVAFVNPKIVKDPQADDEISIEDVELRDKQFVFNMINAPVNQLATFLQEQTSDVDSVDTEQGHGKSAKRPADGKRVGKPDNGDARLVDGVAVRSGS